MIDSFRLRPSAAPRSGPSDARRGVADDLGLVQYGRFWGVGEGFGVRFWYAEVAKVAEDAEKRG